MAKERKQKQRKEEGSLESTAEFSIEEIDIAWSNGDAVYSRNREDNERFKRILRFVPSEEEIRPMAGKFFASHPNEKANCLKRWNFPGFRDIFFMVRRNRGLFSAILWAIKNRFQSLLLFLRDPGRGRRRRAALDELFEDFEVGGRIHCAREQIAGYWTKVLTFTRGDGASGLDKGLILDELLFPDLSRNYNLPKAYKALSEGLRWELGKEVPIGSDDLDLVLKQFCENIKDELHNGSIELPDPYGSSTDGIQDESITLTKKKVALDIALDENNQPHLVVRK